MRTIRVAGHRTSVWADSEIFGTKWSFRMASTGMKHNLIKVMDGSFRGFGKNVFLDETFLKHIFERTVPKTKNTARWYFISPRPYGEAYNKYESTTSYEEFLSLIHPENDFYARQELKSYIERNQKDFIVVKYGDSFNSCEGYIYTGDIKKLKSKNKDIQKEFQGLITDLFMGDFYK